jgi:hypothetical protein
VLGVWYVGACGFVLGLEVWVLGLELEIWGLEFDFGL